jgi:hypothetical protein
MLAEGSGITVGLAALILGALAAVWWRIEGKFDAEQSARESLALNDQNGRMLIQRELQDYKLYVAQNHVTAQALRETEDRLIASFEKVTSRLESIVARLDKLALDMARGGGNSN